MCIAGHHAGLADLGTRNDLTDSFMGRLNRYQKENSGDCGIWRTEIPDEIPTGGENRPGLGNYFYVKMLFSALTDADWLDTEAYFLNRPPVSRTPPLAELLEMLQAYIAPWEKAESEINCRRNRIRNAAIAHAADEPGLFSMTVPTGGGKTISSMAFALHHAVQHGMKRIIYVIPYCSILEQTQNTFESIFGKDNIIAHYSGAEYSSDENREDTRVYSAENWEAPIILTTAVQFFESVYSNRPGKNRKLHNIAQSVIVFDEAQMLPVPFLRPCMAAICELAKNYSCSAVLCTATQPAVEPLLREFYPDCVLRELCPAPGTMYRAFQRVRYVEEGLLSDEELTARLTERRQVLCVVNSRRQAQHLFHLLGEHAGNYHLSTMQIPYDRKWILRQIRDRLLAGQPCRVISTSLIEAGVDLDFPEVYRALAGLDSIIQAGGRCNREGKRTPEESLVHIFSTDAKAPQMLEQNISAAARTLRRCEQADSPEAIRAYFRFLFYTLKDTKQLDEKEILPCAEKLMFRTLSERFHLIEGADHTVYIPVEEGEALLHTLRSSGPNRGIMRQLGQFAVSVRRRYYEELLRAGLLEELSENAGILRDIGIYSRETGLPFEITAQDQAIFI